jgi:3-phosphoshikimate 1-carboxyvinyltransferase
VNEDRSEETTYKVTPVKRPPRVELTVPGSKSITNRALLLAAFADGRSTLLNALKSDDTRVFVDSLNRLGIPVVPSGKGDIMVDGRGGIPESGRIEIYVENAGTACRFLIPACATSKGHFHFDGTGRMRERPLSELLESLGKLGASFSPPGRQHLPLSLMASGISGGVIEIDTSRSSQFLSGLMMASIRAEDDLIIERVGDLVGRPYVDITFDMMKRFGVPVSRDGYDEFTAPAGARYGGITYDVEPDASTASYFFAAAAITGGRVEVKNLWKEKSIQGDIRFLDVLEQIGCTVRSTNDGTIVDGPDIIRGIDIDMKDISDTFMTLAVLAPFAAGPMRIRGIAHTRGQESDRVSAMAEELARLGATVSVEEDLIGIEPSKLTGCPVNTYSDHRIAMALSLIGLRIPGVVITGAECVSKTAPGYFDLLRLVEDAGTNG